MLPSGGSVDGSAFGSWGSSGCGDCCGGHVGGGDGFVAGGPRCRAKQLRGKLKNVGLSYSLCFGIVTGGCVSGNLNRHDGFTFSSGWTGKNRGRFLWGIGGGPGLTYQSTALQNGRCTSALVIGKCSGGGTKQWSLNAPSRYMYAGRVSNKTRLQVKFW